MTFSPQRFNAWISILFFSLSLIFCIHPVSAILTTEETPDSLEFCPFQTGDTSIFSIWGEWEGQHQDQNFGNVSGELSITANFRNNSLLIIYEEKHEIISGIMNSSDIYWRNNPNSYWSFSPKTRQGITLDTYAWMWVAPPDLQIDKNVTIFNYPFLVVREVDFPFNGSLRSTMQMIYAKNTTFEAGENRLNEIHFLFDIQSGHIMYYFVQTQSRYNNGTLFDYGFYSISLNKTTIDLDRSYGPPVPSSTTTSFFHEWAFHFGIVALLFSVLWKNHRKKG